MESEKLLDFSARVGKVLLESGAETSRVEDTLNRIIRHFYSGHSEILVVMTGFFVNIGTLSTTVRVRSRSINLDKVSKINMLSRDIVDGRIDFSEAEKHLSEINRQLPYPLWVKTSAVAVCCSFFTLMESGILSDSLNSLIVGSVLNVLIWFMRKRHTADFIITFMGGAIIAVLTVILYAVGIGENINAMITGSIMPLVPGLGITNALRDILGGDYLSGGARMFDAVVVALALAAGAGVVMYMFGYMSGGKLL